MYRIEGKFPGAPKRKLQIQWDDGIITGDDDAVFGLLNSAKDGVDVGWPGMASFDGMQILQDGTATWVLINRIMIDVEVIAGSLPPIPKASKGGIQ